jgi:hypothetical protein
MHEQIHNDIELEIEERLAGDVESKLPLKKERDGRESLWMREVYNVKQCTCGLYTYLCKGHWSVTPCLI